MKVVVEGAATVAGFTGLGLEVAFVDVNMIVGLVEGDEVLGAELFGVGSGAAAALEATARGRVEREGEEVLQLDEVGDEAAAEEEVG